MSDIVEKIKSMKVFRCKYGVALEEINIAEKTLGIEFSEEYKKYLLAFGAASIYGHELTGLGVGERLNVVDVTVLEREFVNQEFWDMYVIEQTHIDGITIWQTKTGEIYQSKKGNVGKICNSLYEYIDL